MPVDVMYRGFMIVLGVYLAVAFSYRVVKRLRSGHRNTKGQNVDAGGDGSSGSGVHDGHDGDAGSDGGGGDGGGGGGD